MHFPSKCIENGFKRTYASNYNVNFKYQDYAVGHSQMY